MYRNLFDIQSHIINDLNKISLSKIRKSNCDNYTDIKQQRDIDLLDFDKSIINRRFGIRKLNNIMNKITERKAELHNKKFSKYTFTHCYNNYMVRNSINIVDNYDNCKIILDYMNMDNVMELFKIKEFQHVIISHYGHQYIMGVLNREKNTIKYIKNNVNSFIAEKFLNIYYHIPYTSKYIKFIFGNIYYDRGYIKNDILDVILSYVDDIQTIQKIKHLNRLFSFCIRYGKVYDGLTKWYKMSIYQKIPDVKKNIQLVKCDNNYDKLLIGVNYYISKNTEKIKNLTILNKMTETIQLVHKYKEHSKTLIIVKNELLNLIYRKNKKRHFNEIKKHNKEQYNMLKKLYIMIEALKDKQVEVADNIIIISKLDELHFDGLVNKIKNQINQYKNIIKYLINEIIKFEELLEK
jgi:hypothetical protein